MKVFLIIIGIIIILVIGLYAWYGGFHKVECRIEEQGGELLVYKQMTGDYSKSASMMDEVYNSLLKDYQIETYKGFGIYYDNPKTTDKEKLRSDVGCILEVKDSAKVSLLKEKFLIKGYPLTNCIATAFPYKGKLSVFIGIMKVYPAINRFVKEKGYNEDGPIMEIYDVEGKKIYYRKNIE